MLSSLRVSPLSIALGYFIIAAAWILLSDQAIEAIVTTPGTLSVLQSVKGVFFVTVTGVLLYMFSSRLQSDIEDKEESKNIANQEFEKLFRKNPNVMFVYDMATYRFIEVNDRMIRKYGYSRDELMKMTIKDLHPEEEIKMIKDDVESVGTEFNLSSGWTHITKNGERLEVEVSAYPLDYQGKKAELVLIMDITEKVKTERELINTYNELDFHINNTPLAVIQWDKEFRVKKWSAQAENIFGWKKEEVKGLKPEDWSFVHEEDADHVNEMINDLLYGDKKARTINNRNYHKNGSTIYCEWFSSRLVDQNGELISLMSLAHDITEIKLAEQNKQRYQKRFEVAAELTSDVIWEYDLNKDEYWYSNTIGKVFNHPQFAGNTPLDEIFKYIPKKYRDTALATFEKYLENPTGIWSTYYPFQKGDGSWAHVMDRGKMLFDDQGKPVRMVGAMVDISDRVEREQQLRQWNKELENKVKQRTKELETVNQELEAFSYSVSHDLRAPLRSINGFSSALSSHLEDADEDTKHYLDRILNAGERMSSLIDDLLKLSRITRKDVKWENVNLSEIAQTIISELKENEPNRDVTIQLQRDITIKGDQQLIRVMLENLLGNAWKFTQQRSSTEISLSAISQDESLHITLEDNGAGFEQDYSQKLFQPFQRLHSESEFEGTGIGLATVKRIITKHNAEIIASSEKDSEASFIIKWPFH